MTAVKTKLLYVGGSKTSFRCHCGCNCFHQPDPDSRPLTYECNACESWYTGESDDEPVISLPEGGP